ncbi:hypothetical protein AB0K12_46495 [Nonomuraea sp. NPDC049419]
MPLDQKGPAELRRRRVVLDSSSGVPLLPDSAVELSGFSGYDPHQS